MNVADAFGRDGHVPVSIVQVGLRGVNLLDDPAAVRPRHEAVLGADMASAASRCSALIRSHSARSVRSSSMSSRASSDMPAK
jgi:hypothetical protein